MSFSFASPKIASLISIGQLRLDGYKKALKNNGIKPDPKLIWQSPETPDTYSMQNGYEMIRDALKKKPDFTAVFAIADTSLSLLMKWLRKPAIFSLMSSDTEQLIARY